LAEVGAGAQAIRRLLRGDTVTFAGAEEIAMRSIPDVPPPVLIACAGPHGLYQALADGDGAFLLAGADIAVSRWVEQRVGGPEGAEVIRVIPIHVTRTVADGTAWFARWWAALESSPLISDRWVVRSMERWARTVASDVPSSRAPRTARDFERLAEWVGVFGPAAYCRDRLSELHKSQGIERVYLWNAHLAGSAAGIPDAYALPTTELQEIGPLLATLPI
jgi:hypothetical protein